MEKQKIKVNYWNSGVNTLYGFGKFFLIIGFIAMLVAIIGFIVYLTNFDSYSGAENAIIGISLAASFFPISIGSFAAGAICKGLSTIAKTALYKRTLLEEQYYFEETNHNTDY